MRKLTLIPFLLAAVLACTPQAPEAPEMLVVEAWIDSGAPPIVMLSTSIKPTGEDQSMSTITEHLEKWARVAISDGEKEVVLTGKYAKDYFPPYIYTTGRMFGQAGKTYTLTVDTDDYHCVAQTVIPQPVPLESIETVPYRDTPNGHLIKLSWKDNPGEKNVYKAFTRIEGVDSLFAGARNNIVDDALFPGGKAEMMVTPSLSIYRKKGPEPFLSGQRVFVKFCSMDPACVDIMKTLDESITQSGLPIFVSNKNIQGNVSGALGYFVGYGRTIYTVDIP